MQFARRQTVFAAVMVCDVRGLSMMSELLPTEEIGAPSANGFRTSEMLSVGQAERSTSSLGMAFLPIGPANQRKAMNRAVHSTVR